MTLWLTIFKDWCIELHLDTGSPFTSKRLRIGKQWPATYPNWWTSFRLGGSFERGKCVENYSGYRKVSEGLWVPAK